MTKYAVLTETLCDGWINCWSTTENGTTTPILFNTESEAQAEIDDYIQSMKESHEEAVQNGIFEANEEFHEEGERAQLQIVQAQP